MIMDKENEFKWVLEELRGIHSISRGKQYLVIIWF